MSATWNGLHLLSKRGIQRTVPTEDQVNESGAPDRHSGSGNRFQSHLVVFKAMGLGQFLSMTPNSLSMIAF